MQELINLLKELIEKLTVFLNQNKAEVDEIKVPKVEEKKVEEKPTPEVQPEPSKSEVVETPKAETPQPTPAPAPEPTPAPAPAPTPEPAPTPTPAQATSTIGGISGLIVDVSTHQGVVDWNTAKNHISGAILRCGYGSDQTKQDDKQWARNVSECERLGIPYGVYLYSYAKTEGAARSEAQHALRLLAGHHPQLPVFFDSEQKGTEGIANAASVIFCEAIKAAGYTPGVYASESWFNNHLGNTPYIRWIAKYNANNGQQGKRPNVANIWLWQYTSRGMIPGINGGVDVSVVLDSNAVQYNKTNIAVVSPNTTDKIVEARNYIINHYGAGEVAALQTKLNAKGFGCGTVDGIFGKRTYDALVAFQSASGLTPDGKYGPKTHSALNAVTWNQLKADGVMGPATVRRTQEFFGVNVDGIMGPVTIKALQRWLGVNADGHLGPITIKAWQVKMGTKADGVISTPKSKMVMAWQKYLNVHYKC